MISNDTFLFCTLVTAALRLEELFFIAILTGLGLGASCFASKLEVEELMPRFLFCPL
jgi:hypothetical protein